MWAGYFLPCLIWRGFFVYKHITPYAPRWRVLPCLAVYPFDSAKKRQGRPSVKPCFVGQDRRRPARFISLKRRSGTFSKNERKFLPF
jgi:hypothetical protein